MDDMTRMYSMLSTQNFLLGQLYARFFSSNPEAREQVPKAMIHAATFKSHTASADVEQEALIEMQAQIVLNLQHFFSDVERRLQGADRAAGK